MESSFLQGQTLVLARLEREDCPAANLASAGGNKRRLAAILAGHRSPSDFSRRRRLSRGNFTTGLLCGFRYLDHCFFAFDLNHQTRYGRNGIKSVSPFVLIGSDTVLHKPDVERIALRMKGHVLTGDDNGIPKAEHIQDGLNHPNPEVRAIAKRLMDISQRQSNKN